VCTIGGTPGTPPTCYEPEGRHTPHSQSQGRDAASQRKAAQVQELEGFNRRKKHIGYPGCNPNIIGKHIYDHPGVDVTCSPSRVSDPVSKASILTWHARLGHVNKDYIKRTAAGVEGIEITTDEGQPQAADCIVKYKIRQIQYNKIRQNASNTKSGNSIFPYTQSQATKHAAFISCTEDIAYALPETIHGAKYFLVLGR